MNELKSRRLKRAGKTRARQARLGVIRLTVYRTPNHIYAQIIEPGTHGCLVKASASTLDKSLKESVKEKTTKTEKAKAVGRLIAQRAKEAGITKLAFDRSGYKYHGRVKALADAAREEGIEF